MLRSVESKVGGLVLVVVFLLLLWVPTFNVSCGYSVPRQVVFWWFVSVFFLLSYLGACHPEFPYIVIRRLSSAVSILLLFVFKCFWKVPHSRGLPEIVFG